MDDVVGEPIFVCGDRFRFCAMSARFQCVDPVSGSASVDALVADVTLGIAWGLNVVLLVVIWIPPWGGRSIALPKSPDSSQRRLHASGIGGRHDSGGGDMVAATEVDQGRR
jgi:hypothetical protein